LSALNTALLVIGALVIAVGLFSELVKRIVAPPVLAFLVGVLLGPAVFGVLDPFTWGNEETILEEAARLTVAVAVMGVALRLPAGYPFSRWRSLMVMLGLVMPFMWLSSGLLTYLVLGSPFWVAMLVGAVVTPTDPVVASSIVQGNVAEENLPARIRHLLSGESGANDGLAYPFVFLPILVLQVPAGEVLSHWLLKTVLWEVVGATACGVVIGYAAGKVLEWTVKKGTAGRPSFLAYTLALTLAVLGGAKLIGTDGILAVFVAGIALNMTTSAETRGAQQDVQEAVNRFFILPIFVLLGLTLPWEKWAGLGWAGLVLVGFILLLRRLPAVVALSPLVPETQKARDVFFLGWFGPIGVAALYYATLSVHEADAKQAWVVGSLAISASVLVHGLTAGPLTSLYGRLARVEEGESE
jgi:NhaP-type Na+/H+ or K+/H+ antiporter